MRDQPSSPLSSSPKDEKEKTIPFLRQLTEMLQNNEELISFVPGQRLPNETIHGKIIVHDRNRVQSEVLPVYFNHASFASLRRQLSYFSFVRVGKSRQSGVTYTNDSVVELADIRKLKRRVVGQAGAAVKHQQKRAKQPPTAAQDQTHQDAHQAQKQQERQLTTTSADVASAVLSGTLHAAKTNHNLDMANSTNAAAATVPGRQVSNLRTSPICHRSSTTQSSISQSFETSSSGSSEEGNASSGDGKNDKAAKKNTNTKVGVRKRSRSSIPKPAIPRKERARFDKLLSINNIVPFIHLPAGHKLSSKITRKKEERSASTGESGGSNANGCCNNNNKKEAATTGVNFQKENAPGRRRAPSETAINALLALGAQHTMPSFQGTAAPA